MELNALITNFAVFYKGYFFYCRYFYNKKDSEITVETRTHVKSEFLHWLYLQCALFRNVPLTFSFPSLTNKTTSL